MLCDPTAVRSLEETCLQGQEVGGEAGLGVGVECKTQKRHLGKRKGKKILTKVH